VITAAALPRLASRKSQTQKVGAVRLVGDGEADMTRDEDAKVPTHIITFSFIKKGVPCGYREIASGLAQMPRWAIPASG
jgi:hypothetical protein